MKNNSTKSFYKLFKPILLFFNWIKYEIILSYLNDSIVYFQLYKL